MSNVSARPIRRPVLALFLLRLRGEWPHVAATLLCAVLFYLVPWAPIYGAALLAVGALAYARPARALVLVPLFSPLYMQPKHLGPERFAPSEIFLLVVCLCCLLPGGAIWGERDRLMKGVRAEKWLPPLALFVVGAAVSTAFAVDRHQAVQYFRLVVLEPAIFAVLLLALEKSTEDWLLLFAGVLLAGAVVAAVALAQQVTQQGLGTVPGSTVVHVRSVYGSPNNLALLFDRVLPLTLAGLLVPQRAVRFVFVLLSTVFVAVLVLSGSRGAWLAVAVGCLVMLALRFSWGKWLALAGLVLAGALLAGEGHKVVSALQVGHTGTVSKRMDIWRSSIHMLRDHPVVGIGPDNFRYYYSPRNQLYMPCSHGLGYMEPEANNEPCLSHPHNEFLDFYLSTGVLGLAAFLWLQVLFWTGARRAWKYALENRHRLLLLGTIGAMTASLSHGLVDNAYFLVDLSILFWLLMVYVFWLNGQVHAGGPVPHAAN